MEEREIKLEFNLNDPFQCPSCLSVGRKLAALGQYAEIYKKITTSIEYHGMQPPEQVCWECRALLRKVAQFQQRVESAQQAFQLGQVYTSTLSNLTKVVFNDTHPQTIYINNEIDTQITKIETDEELSNENYNEGTIDENNLTEEYETTDKTKMEYEFENKEIEKVLKPVNRWARKRALQNKKPKFRILTNKDINKLFRIEKIDSIELEKYLQKRRCKKSYISNKYKCETCIIGFKNKNDLLEHQKNRHDINIGPYSCDVCAAIFKDKRHLSAHVGKHYTRYCCALCRHSARGHRGRHKHAETHGKVFQCVKCELLFGGRREFYQHFKAWHEKYTCDHCGVSFKMRYCIKEHLRKQHSPFECVPCNKRFARYNGLWLHNKVHHAPSSGARGYCVECDKHYPDIYRYRWHLANSARHKPRKKARVPCPGCDKVFSKNIYMRNHHDLVHLQRYKHRCQPCDKNFIRNADLVKHRRRVHEGIAPPRNKICYLCGRGFTTNKILSNHIRTHTGERPFACALCPARFAQAAALTGHTRALHQH